MEVLEALDPVFDKDARSMGGCTKLKPVHAKIAVSVCKIIDRHLHAKGYLNTPEDKT